MKVLLFLISTLLLINLYSASSVHEFDVFRLIQFDKGNEMYGSRRTNVNLLATTITALESERSLSRHIVVVHCEKVDRVLLELFQRESAPAGLLIVIPERIGGESQWRDMEELFLRYKFEGPVYFVYETNEISEMYEFLVEQENGQESGIFGTDTWRLVVGSTEAKPITKFPVRNYDGKLIGSSDDKTLAIVANYDTFGISPGLATGTDMNGSGVISILEIARLFSKLYADARSKSEYNIVFVLTSSGRQNFEATEKWLEKVDDDLESFDMVLCLNALLSDNLHLHVSRSEKNPAVKAVYEVFSNIAKKHNIPFEITRRSIDLGKKEIPFQHEQFARKKLFSFTLSGNNYSSSKMNSTDIYDLVNENSFELLNKNINYLADVIAHLIYDLDDDISLFTDDYSVYRQYTETWLTKMGESPRMMPYILVEKDNALLDGIEREMRKYLSEVSVQETEIQHFEIVFYDKAALTMFAYRAKPLIFDVIFSIAVIIYCAVLFVALNGTDESIATVKALLQKRKK